jgi:alpha-L-fucosidase
MEILLYTWGADGNMLLNIGPRGDGSLNPDEVGRLEQIADWWSVNGGTSIRNSRGGPYLPGHWGVSTRKENRVYLHVFRWPSRGPLTLRNIPGNEIQSARLLNGGKMNFRKGATNYDILVKEKYREDIVTTIELTLNGSVMELEAFYAQDPLTLGAKLTASHNQEETGNLTDQDPGTYWHVDTGNENQEIFLEALWDSPVSIGSLALGRGEEWRGPRNNPELQVPDGKGGWLTVFSWKQKWEPVKLLDKPVTTDRIRLKVSGISQLELAEFELYAPL